MLLGVEHCNLLLSGVFSVPVPLTEVSRLVVTETVPLSPKNALLDLREASLVLQACLGESC